MKKISLLLFFLACLSATRAQNLAVFDVNTSFFPVMMGKFYATDADAEQILSLTKEDFAVFENGVSREVIEISCPEPKPPQALSSVLTLDISGSMNGGNMSIAKKAALAWIDMLPMRTSECAVTSFNNAAYLNLDFSKNRTKLAEAVNGLHPHGGTAYQPAFLDPNAGALTVVARGMNKRVVVFLTDGMADCDENAVVNRANEIGATVFVVVVNMAAPQVLKNIATRTGGQWFDFISSKDQAVNVYKMIQHIAQNREPCLIKWRSGLDCRTKREVVIEIPNLSLSNNFSYIAPDNSYSLIELNPSAVDLGGITPGTLANFVFTLTARNADVNIFKIEGSNPRFSITDWGGQPPPFLLAQNDSRTIRGEYNAIDSGMVYDLFKIETDACSNRSYFVQAGFPGVLADRTITLTHPNGGERFVAGVDSCMTWEGTLPDKQVRLEYSTNAGKSWRFVAGDADDNYYDWKVPNTPSDSCLARVIAEFGIEEDPWIRGVYSQKDEVYVQCVDVDSKGNVFIAGRYQQDFQVETGNSYSNNLGDGYNSIFVAKISKEGKVIWTKHSNEHVAYVYGMCVDDQGAVYISGYYQDDLAFDGVQINGDSDGYIAKFDPAGNCEWITPVIAAYASYHYVADIDYQNGALITCGEYRGGLDFGNGVNLSGVGFYVAKYDLSGACVMAKSIKSSSGSTYQPRICWESSGAYYLAAPHTGFTVYENGDVLGSSDTKEYHIDVSKFDKDDKLVWAKDFWTEEPTGNGVRVEATDYNSVVVAGAFKNQITVDNQSVSTGSNLQGGFVSVLDGEGNLIWMKAPSCATDFYFSALALDRHSNIYLGGLAQSSVDFGDGVSLQSANYTPLVVGYDLAGAAEKMFKGYSGGVGAIANILGLQVDKNNTIYAGGYFKNRFNFENIEEKTGIGFNDGFLAQIPQEEDKPRTDWVAPITLDTTHTVSGRMDIDSKGYSYVCGTYDKGKLNFNNGIELTSNYPRTLYIAKFDPQGLCIWAKNIGSDNNINTQFFACNVSADAEGNIYLFGSHYRDQILDFNGGIAGARNNLFVAKLDTDGNFQWMKEIKPDGSAFKTTAGFLIEASENGFIYIAHPHTSDADVDGNIISASNSLGSYFIARFDSDGNYQSGISLRSTNADRIMPNTARDLYVDINGDLYAAGDFMGDIDFGNGVAANSGDAKEFEAYVAKFDENLDCQWATTVGGSGSDFCYCVAANSNGDVYAAGMYGGEGKFCGKELDPVNTEYNTYVLYLDSDGNCRDAFNLKNENAMLRPADIAVDDEKNCYLSGRASGPVRFSDDKLFSPKGNYDAFIAKFDKRGSFVELHHTSNEAYSSIQEIKLYSQSEIYAIGNCDSTTMFNEDEYTLNIPKDDRSIFVWKIGASGHKVLDESDSLWAIVSPRAKSFDIDMGTVIVGEYKDSVVTAFISNVGAAPFSVDSIYFSGNCPDEFSVVSGFPPYEVGGGETKNVEFRFKPAAENLRDAIVNVVLSFDTLRVGIRGNGFNPEVETSPNVIDFQIVRVGSSKDTNEVVITNMGPAPTRLDSVALLGPDVEQFSILQANLPVDLAANESLKLPLRFDARRIGRTGCDLAAYYDYLGSPAITKLYGEGIVCGPGGFDITDFSDAGDLLTYVGDAQVLSDRLRLTPAQKNLKGAAWTKNKIDVARGFLVDFIFNVSRVDIKGADGFAFVVQNHEADALGTRRLGESLGYDSIPNSVAVEFDYHKNDYDPGYNHIAVQCAGTNPNRCDHFSQPPIEMAQADILGAFDSNIYCRIEYGIDPQTLRVFLSNDGAFGAPLIEATVDIPSLLALDDERFAWVGLTAGTGGERQNHDIIAFSICPQTKCGDPHIEINTSDVDICAGESATLSVDDFYSEYVWSTGDSTNIITVSESGTYSIETMDPAGCIGEGEIEIRVRETPEAAIDAERPYFCEGSAVKLKATPEGEDYSYEWSNGETTPEIDVDVAGVYSVKVESVYGCAGESSTIQIEQMTNTVEISAEGQSLEIDSTVFGYLRCVDIEIKNITDETVMLDDAKLVRNSAFSIPPSQLPLEIPPRGSVPLKICYKPQNDGAESDTLSIEDFCDAHLLPLLAVGMENLYVGDSRCRVTLRAQTDIASSGAFLMLRPYPNPSGGKVEFRYELLEEAHVKLTLENALGGRVATLVDAKLAEGAHSAAFDAENLPSGVYFYKLSAGGDVETGAIVIEK